MVVYMLTVCHPFNKSQNNLIKKKKKLIFISDLSSTIWAEVNIFFNTCSTFSTSLSFSLQEIETIIVIY